MHIVGCRGDNNGVVLYYVFNDNGSGQGMCLHVYKPYK